MDVPSNRNLTAWQEESGTFFGEYRIRLLKSLYQEGSRWRIEAPQHFRNRRRMPARQEEQHPLQRLSRYGLEHSSIARLCIQDRDFDSES